VTGLSILGLLPGRSSRVTGEVRFEGRDLLKLSAREMRKVRGRQISMIFQEPMSALDPVFTIGHQIGETLRAHRGIGKKEARERAVEALAQVGIPLPARRVDEYPHQLSGGMRQRAMIAIALSCEPKLLIADEPTTALDVTVQAEIIDLMAELCAAKGTAILMISHDLGLVANMCRRVAVMYAGRIVESQVAGAIFATPRHPYTQGLVDSLPRLGERSRRGQQRLREIAGVVPSIAAYPPGCRFNPRCPAVTDICRSVAPDITPLPADGLVRCHHHG
ncbi:MAG: ABC transporter ATP-binding protein, partial [Reyranella sp.]